jgi:hypothetical protein
MSFKLQASSLQRRTGTGPVRCGLMNLLRSLRGSKRCQKRELYGYTRASPGDGPGVSTSPHTQLEVIPSLAESNMTVRSSSPYPVSSKLATKAARTGPQIACSAAEVLRAAGHLCSDLVVFLRLVKDLDTRRTEAILLNVQPEGHVLSRSRA